MIRNPRSFLIDSKTGAWSPKFPTITRAVDEFLHVNPVPKGWIPRIADNRHGYVIQQPGPLGHKDAYSIRIKAPTPDAIDPAKRTPNGVIRYHGSSGQPLDLAGKPGSQALTHLDPRASQGVTGWRNLSTGASGGGTGVVQDAIRGVSNLRPPASVTSLVSGIVASPAWNASSRILTSPVAQSAGRAFARVAGPLGAVVGAVDIAANWHAEGGFGTETQKATGRTLGGLGGAAAGAMIGSMIFPGVGTVVGAIVGGLIGSGVGEHIANGVVNVVGSVAQGVGDAIGGVGDAIGGVGDAVDGAANAVGGFLADLNPFD